MKFQKKVWCQTIVVVYFAALSLADQDYDNKLTKRWKISSESNSDGSAVVNVTSASIVIQSPSYKSDPISSRTSRVSKNFTPYVFRPRAIPLKRVEEPPQEKNVYYTQDNKYKTEILLPGNYFPIPKEKSTERKYTVSSPVKNVPFETQAIPLIRSQDLEKRSLDVNLDPIEEEPEETYETQQASRRSLSDILGGEDEEDIEDDDSGEYEVEDDTEKAGLHPHKIRQKLKKVKKYSKYMLPLLLAYKMKFFTLIPLMMGGLVLLVGATGLAGFFFALFAAVMGLQKGSV